MHTNAPECPRCTETLRRVHPDLVRWVKTLRATHPDAHVSCGYRGEKDQEAAFTAGTSHAHYGQSPHNTLPSLAVDLFRLTQQAGASFDAPWYHDVVHPIARAAGLTAGIQYMGADGKLRQDMPHVELPGFKAAKP